MFPYIIHVLQSIYCYNYSRDHWYSSIFVFLKKLYVSVGKKLTLKVYSMPSFKIHNTSLVSFSTLLKGIWIRPGAEKSVSLKKLLHDIKLLLKDLDSVFSTCCLSLLKYVEKMYGKWIYNLILKLSLFIFKSQIFIFR